MRISIHRYVCECALSLSLSLLYVCAELRVVRLSLVRKLSIFAGETAKSPLLVQELVVGTRLFDATAAEGRPGGEDITDGPPPLDSDLSTLDGSDSDTTDLFVQDLSVTVPLLTIPSAEGAAFFSLSYVVRVSLQYSDRQLDCVLELPVHISHPVCCFQLKPPEMVFPVLPYQEVFTTDDLPEFQEVRKDIEYEEEGVVTASPVGANVPSPVLYQSRETIEAFVAGMRHLEKRGAVGGESSVATDVSESFEGLSLVASGEGDADDFPASIGMWMREDRVLERRRKRDLYIQFQRQQVGVLFSLFSLSQAWRSWRCCSSSL